jgi:hypothetical protein
VPDAGGDPVAAFLADTRMQAEDHHLVPAGMVLPLLAAFDAVLKLADEHAKPGLQFIQGGKRWWDLDPAKVREAVTAPLREGDGA